MALFKTLRGKEDRLPSVITDGYCYFCSDTSNFFIDHRDASGNLVRSKISARFADKLRYVEDGETIELDAADIATHAYVDTKVSSLEIIPKLTDDGVLYFTTNLLTPAEEELF